MKISNSVFIFIGLFFVYFTEGRISDKRLCGDPTCSIPVSKAKTLLRYVSDDVRMLSFGQNFDVTIYSKSAGSKPDLWGAEIKGKRGYVPKGFVREYKILKSSLPYIVDTGEPEDDLSNKLKNVTNITPSISSSIETNKGELHNSQSVPSEKSNQESRDSKLQSKTPMLEEPPTVKSIFADISFPSFPGSGVSAEPYDGESVPNPEDISQPYTVIDGTTITYDTDGSQIEPKSNTINPTVISPSPQPSIVPEHSTVSSKDVDISTTEIPIDKESTNKVNTEENDDILEIEEAEEEEEGSARKIYQYISQWMSEGSGASEKEKESEEISDDNNISQDPIQDEKVGVVKDTRKEVETNRELENEHLQETHLNVEKEKQHETGDTPMTKRNEDTQTEMLENISESPPASDAKNEAEAIKIKENVDTSVEGKKNPDTEKDIKKDVRNGDELPDEEDEDEGDYDEDEEYEDDEEEDEEDIVENVSEEVTKPTFVADVIKPVEEEETKAKDIVKEDEINKLNSKDIESFVNPVTSDIESQSLKQQGEPFTVPQNQRQTVPHGHQYVTPIPPEIETVPSGHQYVAPVLSEVETVLPPTEDQSKTSGEEKKVENVRFDGVSNSFAGGDKETRFASNFHGANTNKLDKELSVDSNAELKFADSGKGEYAPISSSELQSNYSVTSDKSQSEKIEPKSTVLEEESDGKDKVDPIATDANSKEIPEQPAIVDSTIKDSEHSLMPEFPQNENNIVAKTNKDAEQPIVPESPLNVEAEQSITAESVTEHFTMTESSVESVEDVMTPMMEKSIEVTESSVDKFKEHSVITESHSEELTEDSMVTDASLSEVTEPSMTADSFELPLESLTERPNFASTVSPDEELLDEKESVDSSQGLLTQFTSFVHSLFGGSPEVLNEREDTTEKIYKVDEPGQLDEKTDDVWNLKRSGYGENSISSDGRKSSVCKVDSDRSAGIDSDCGDVVGNDPVYMHNKKEVLNELEDVTVKVSDDDNLIMDLQRSSYDIFVFLTVTGVTVLLFTLGYFYLEKKRRDGSLVAKMNELEKALLVSSKECLILKDDLQATKEKLLSFENSSVDSSEVVTTLKVELEECKVAKTELEEQVASLEKELEGATEAGLELNRMLSEFLSAQNSSESVMKSVEHLQTQLDSQQDTILTLTESLNDKTQENESLQADLNSALEKLSSLEETVEKVNGNLKDVLSDKLIMEGDLLERNKLLITELDEMEKKRTEEVSALQNEIATLQETISEMKDNLVTKESEVSVLQDCLKQLKSIDDGEGDDKLQELLDVGHTKAELKLMTIERDTLSEKLQGEEDARKLLEDHVRIVTEEVRRLRESYEEAEKEKLDAQTKLQVLSNYFKEKETQLQKELGLQEAMCLQKEGDATSTHERIKSLEEEVENYKSQNETLKKEIIDQERSLKAQVVAQEKKAHENWLAARQAERKLGETKEEAKQLRNMLTIIEKNATNAAKINETSKLNDRLPGDSNGDLTTSPVHMGITSLDDSSSSPQLFRHDGLTSSPALPSMMPGPPLPPNPFIGLPPPGVFMPPPPPPSYMYTDGRPPPLGRMSSPPPPPDLRGAYSPYDDRSASPSPPRYRSPPPHKDDSPERFRQHRTPPPPPPPSHFSPYTTPTSRLPPHWEDSHGASRSGFRPLPPPTLRDSPREPKGSAMSSGHSSESLEKSSRHSGRV